MNISRQRKKLARLDHRNALLPRRRGSLFKVQLSLDRNHEHIMLAALANGHERFEHLIGILTQSRSNFRARNRSFGVVKQNFVRQPRRIEHAHGVGLILGLIVLRHRVSS